MEGAAQPGRRDTLDILQRDLHDAAKAMELLAALATSRVVLTGPGAEAFTVAIKGWAEKALK
jgi:hypothetical protein